MRFVVVKHGDGRIDFESTAALEQQSRFLGKPVVRQVLATCDTMQEAGIMAGKLRVQNRASKKEFSI